MISSVEKFIAEIENARAKAIESRCSDGNCILRGAAPRGGMHTNGGCHCLDGYGFEKRLAIRRHLIAANSIEALCKMLKLSLKALNEINIRRRDQDKIECGYAICAIEEINDIARKAAE